MLIDVNTFVFRRAIFFAVYGRRHEARAKKNLIGPATINLIGRRHPWPRAISRRQPVARVIIWSAFGWGETLG
jgi:hypothetical protein